MLEGGGHVLAAETRHVLSHVSSENLVKRRRLLAVVVDILRNFLRYEVRLLQGLDQVPRNKRLFSPDKYKIDSLPQELVCILLTSVNKMFANNF